MTNLTVGILGFVALFALMILRTPVAFAMLLAGFFGTWFPEGLGNGLAALGLGPFGTLMVILLSYIVLGMFLDGLAMLVVTVPIYFPVIIALGFDPIWFGVVVVIVIEMGMITPPVGLNVFVVRNVAQDVGLGTVFRGVTPFLIAMILCLALIIAIPEIALLIPNSMFN